MGASQSAKHAADDSLLPNGPILRLQSYAWSRIATNLDYVCIKNLLQTGNRVLYRLVAHNCQTLLVNHAMHSIDVERIIHLCNTMNTLRELRIEPPLSETCALKPSTALILPQTLTSLYLHFSYATDFGLTLLLKKSVPPSLTSLVLCGETSQTVELAQCSLPPALSTLKLKWCTVRVADETVIMALPRSITMLALTVLSLPTFTQYCWPPHLESLELGLLEAPLVLEDLPRTVADLALEGSVLVTTRYKNGKGTGEFIFPFRCFFPFLSSLTLKLKVPGDIEPLFGSIFSPTACDMARVDEFITDGFWSLPGLEHSANRSYPLLRSLVLSRHEIRASLVPEMSLLAPYLADLQYLSSYRSWSLPAGILQYLPNLRRFIFLQASPICASVEPPDLINLHKLVHLHFESLPTSIAKSFTNLESLHLKAITNDEVVAVAPWQSTLKQFAIESALPNGFHIGSLPTELTYLEFFITSDEEWSAVATSLICLETLKITLSAPGTWMRSERLAPMKSTTLKHATIPFNSYPKQSQPKRFMEEFLGLQSPLPRSLTHLEILVSLTSILLIPMTICPYLPRNLRSLTLGTRIAWSSTQYKADLPVINFSPAELLSCLPPHLESLTIDQRYRTPLMTHELFGCLPKSLTSFVQEGLELLTPPSTASLWSTVLPPNLALLRLRSEFDYTYFVPLRRLYCGTIDPTIALPTDSILPRVLEPVAEDGFRRQRLAMLVDIESRNGIKMGLDVGNEASSSSAPSSSL